MLLRLLASPYTILSLSVPVRLVCFPSAKTQGKLTLFHCVAGNLNGSKNDNTGSGVVSGANPNDNTSMDKKEQPFPGYGKLTEQSVIHGANPIDDSSSPFQIPTPTSNSSSIRTPAAPTKSNSDKRAHGADFPSNTDTDTNPAPAQYYPGGGTSSGIEDLPATDERTVINKVSNEDPALGPNQTPQSQNTRVIWGANPLSNTSTDTNPVANQRHARFASDEDMVDMNESSGGKGLRVTEDQMVIGKTSRNVPSPTSGKTESRKCSF